MQSQTQVNLEKENPITALGELLEKEKKKCSFELLEKFPRVTNNISKKKYAKNWFSMFFN